MAELTVPELVLDAAQLRRNVAAVRARIAPSQLMLAMKDDAYGHGIEWVLDALAQDRELVRFGGYDIRSGARIRARRPEARIFAWAASTDDEIAEALVLGIELGIGSIDYLERVIAVAQRVSIPAAAHLKIDTGLRRSGVLPGAWEGFLARAAEAQRAGSVRIVGLWSHLAEASDAEDDAAAARFARALSEMRRAGLEPAETHLTASAASWWRPELRGSVSRIGAFCYGIRSADGPEIPGTAPVVTLRARVLAVDDGLAEIGVGRLHGLPSNLVGAPVGTPAGARVLRSIGAVRATVEAWPGATRGDVVHVFGPGVLGESDATALAERIDTVGEEIVTRLTAGVRRVTEN